MERGIVTVVLGTIDDSSLDIVEEAIRAARERATAENIHNLRIEIETVRGWYDSISANVQILGTRDETDEEYTARTGRIVAQQEQTAAQRRALYEQLKREFGDA